MAPGADRNNVQRAMLHDGMRLAGIGVAIGIAISLAASRFLTAYLCGVSPVDAMTHGVVASLFVGVTLFAKYLPARRAALANPVAVLRGE